MKTEKSKHFIFQWLLGLLITLVTITVAVLSFVENQIGAGIAISVFSVILLIKFIFFEPHSVAFDGEKVTLYYVFKSEAVKYSNIKSCDKTTSGIKSYPYGEYYNIIVDKPYLRELKIPYTKEIDLNIKKYIKTDHQNGRRKKKK